MCVLGDPQISKIHRENRAEIQAAQGDCIPSEVSVHPVFEIASQRLFNQLETCNNRQEEEEKDPAPRMTHFLLRLLTMLVSLLLRLDLQQIVDITDTCHVFRDFSRGLLLFEGIHGAG